MSCFFLAIFPIVRMKETTWQLKENQSSSLIPLSRPNKSYKPHQWSHPSVVPLIVLANLCYTEESKAKLFSESSAICLRARIKTLILIPRWVYLKHCEGWRRCSGYTKMQRAQPHAQWAGFVLPMTSRYCQKLESSGYTLIGHICFPTAEFLLDKVPQC